MAAQETKIAESPGSVNQTDGSTFLGQALPEQGRDDFGMLKTDDNSGSGQAIPKQLSGSGLSRQNRTAHKLHTAKVKQTELILFTTQLSVMLDSGVVLSDALDAIAEQAEHGTFRMIIMEVSERVKGGDDFSKALSVYPKVFGSMFISMVEASEASGKMSEMLSVLSGYLNFEADTRKRVKGALTYPIIMALMAVAATGTLMFFVLPRFMGIYEARGAALPKLTQILVGFSKMLGDLQTMTTILTILVLASIGFYYWAGTVSGRRIIDFVKIRTPVLGTMFVDMIVTRSMRIMSTMVNTGVSLLDAIEVIQGASDNYYFQCLWAGADRKIRDGYQLSESIMISQQTEGTQTELIEQGIIQMLRAGEKGGKLGEVCDKISTFYEKKLEASIKHVTALIEPIMIAVLGAIIGTIAIALLMPVFRISTIIAH
jgi:type IV pilus assembly protein PilC